MNKGFHILKIKVGIGDISDDIARIQAIRSRVGGNVKLRLDANQGWTPKEAVTAIRKMEDAWALSWSSSLFIKTISPG